MGTPQEPIDVKLDTTPIAQVARLTRGQSTQLTWKAGVPGDRIELEIKQAERPGDFSCTFDDAAGSATVPADAFVSAGTVRVEFHRLRTTTASVKGIDRIQVEFDYALDHLLEIVD
jgi:hypothetical protein